MQKLGIKRPQCTTTSSSSMRNNFKVEQQMTGSKILMQQWHSRDIKPVLFSTYLFSFRQFQGLYQIKGDKKQKIVD